MAKSWEDMLWTYVNAYLETEIDNSLDQRDKLFADELDLFLTDPSPVQLTDLTMIFDVLSKYDHSEIRLVAVGSSR